jgi:hypothetical protein
MVIAAGQETGTRLKFVLLRKQHGCARWQSLMNSSLIGPAADDAVLVECLFRVGADSILA